jgi:pectinesterase
MNCELPATIRPEGWHHWQKNREQTARYMEYNNRGAGADTSKRVSWSRQLSKKEAQQITLEKVFERADSWMPKL